MTVRAVLLVAALAALDARAAPATLRPVEGAEECAVLAALDFSEALGVPVRITAAQAVPDKPAPPHCRVAGRISPEVGFEVWLPLDRWNGRLLMTGCYNLCGSLRTDQMEDALARGYATVTTDMGHSRPKETDASWAANNRSARVDFGYRATHLTALLAKDVAAAYYGRRPDHAYFRGCSTGGRQALVEAQRYPDDFEGIVAGAPFNQELSVPHMIWVDHAVTGADGRPLLGHAQFELLQKAVLAACDADDGLADGVVGDPENCRFNPATLACTGKPGDDCLTPEQVEAVSRIYQGPANGRGERFAPLGTARGSEFTWESRLVGRDGKPSFFRGVLQTWLQNFAFEPDPPADAPPVFDFDRDPPRLAATIRTVGYTPALDRFRARDGRLILWHGWADESLMPAHTLEYWRRVNDALGTAAVASFARLYMLPGVTHCGGGPGAGDVDFLTLIERWVEEDEAPDAITAWRTRTSVPALERQPRFPVPAGDVVLARPVYPWPDVAHYAGKGDPNDTASFERVRRGTAAAPPAPRPAQTAPATPAPAP